MAKEILDYVAIALVLACLAGGGARFIETVMKCIEVIREHRRMRQQ